MMQKRCCSRAEGLFVCLAQPSGLGSRPGLDVRANGPVICPQRSSKWPGRWPSPFIALRYPARRAGLDKGLGLWPEDAGSISAPPPSTSTFIAPCSIFDISIHTADPLSIDADDDDDENVQSLVAGFVRIRDQRWQSEFSRIQLRDKLDWRRYRTDNGEVKARLVIASEVFVRPSCPLVVLLDAMQDQSPQRTPPV